MTFDDDATDKQDFTGQEQDFTEQRQDFNQKKRKRTFTEDNMFTEKEFRQEMRDFVLRLEEDNNSLREVRRQYLLDYIRIHKGIEIISIQGSVVYFKRVPVVSDSSN